jgi:MFS family permease
VSRARESEPVLDGPAAWAAVAVAFTAMFTTFGIAYGFGAFLLPLSRDLGVGRGAASAVFSLTTMAFFGLGALSGAALDRFGPRRVVLLGAVSLGAGLVVVSRADSLWQAYLGHGLGVGLAVACCYVPLVAVVGAWFDARRTLAVGIAVSGIGLGTLVGAPTAAALIAAVGWRNAYLVLAAAGTGVLLVCALFARAAPLRVDAVRVPLLPRLRTPTYLRLYGAGLLLSVALFVPFVHLPAYAVSTGSGAVAAATLVGVIGAASIGGRLALGALAGRVGVLRTYQACFLVMAGSFALWLSDLRLGEPSYARLVVFAALLGVGYGGFVALGPPLVAEVFGLEGLGSLLGVLYTSAAVGSALGPPLAGVLITSHGYLLTVVASLAVCAVSCLLVLRVRP